MDDFLKYVFSVWGLISVSTVFFPVSNQLIGLIEPPHGFDPKLVLTLNSLFCAFSFFWLYVRRNEQRYSTGSAAKFFVGAIFALAVYLARPTFDFSSSTDPEAQARVSDFLYLLGYFAIFVGLTVSFALLAVKDRFQPPGFKTVEEIEDEANPSEIYINDKKMKLRR